MRKERLGHLRLVVVDLLSKIKVSVRMSLVSWLSAIKLLTCPNPPTPLRDHLLVVPSLQTPATGVELADPEMHTGLYYAKHFKLTRELMAGLK